VVCDQATSCIDPNVGGEREEARGDQLLRSPLCALRSKARPGEEPEDHKTGESFDQAVGAETDQRDRACGDAHRDRDGELEEVVCDAAPCEPSRLQFEPGAVAWIGWRGAGEPLDLQRLAHALSVQWAGICTHRTGWCLTASI
jgi:hypothetical protein